MPTVLILLYQFADYLINCFALLNFFLCVKNKILLNKILETVQSDYSSDPGMIAVFVSLAILLVIAYQYLRWNYDYWRARGVPYEKPVIFFGNFKESMMRRRHVSEDFSQFY